MTDTSREQGDLPKPQARRPFRLTWRRLLIMLACVLGLTAFGARHWGYCYYATYRLSALLTEIRIPEAVAVAQRYGTSLDCPQVRLLSIRAHRQAGDLQAADRLLSASENLIDSPKRVSQERTLIHVRNGRLSANAVQLPQMLRDPDLDGRDVCEAFAIGFRLNRRFEEAGLLIDAWKADWPTDYRPFYHEGLMYQTLTNWNAAVSAYRTAVSLNPLADACRVRLGECLNQIERGKEACEQFQIVTSRDRDNIAAWQGLADGLRQQGDDKSARIAYLQVLALDSGSFSARLSIAEIDFDDGDITSATKNIDKLSSVWPDDARTLYLQSRIAALAGRHKDSASLQERWKRADLAVQQVEREIQLLGKSPDNMDLQVSIGTGMMNHYSRELGQQFIVAALQIAPNHSAAAAALTDFKARRKRLKMIPIPDSKTGQASGIAPQKTAP